VPARHAALVGPTASGKSALALALARADPTWELVTVDSMQVYRGMDIGTAKPTPAERARVPHHLIDLVDPDESYSTGRWREDAIRAIGEIAERGRIPLLVGGTMLYYRALVGGLDVLPPRDPQVWGRLARLALELADREGYRRATQRVFALDPLNPAAESQSAVAEQFLAPPASSATATGTPLVAGSPAPTPAG